MSVTPGAPFCEARQTRLISAPCDLDQPDPVARSSAGDGVGFGGVDSEGHEELLLYADGCDVDDLGLRSQDDVGGVGLGAARYLDDSDEVTRAKREGWVLTGIQRETHDPIAGFDGG